jgi:hypothetical protein
MLTMLNAPSTLNFAFSELLYSFSCICRFSYGSLSPRFRRQQFKESCSWMELIMITVIYNYDHSLSTYFTELYHDKVLLAPPAGVSQSSEAEIRDLTSSYVPKNMEPPKEIHKVLGIIPANKLQTASTSK